MTTAEHRRRDEIGHPEDDLFDASPWYEWGPYLSERAWGTVREDYSPGGDAWTYFPHDHARSRAYRWNEDGLAGISDLHHDLCFALALWNGEDPILKERIFGLTGPQGNHGEDAKEYWWYLDALPSHAWLRWRYHYPQTAFPYDELLTGNAARGRDEPELELLDTGAFDDDRYWIVEARYAKASPTDIAVHLVIDNAGAEAATLHVLPTLWFRNTWSWATAGEPPGITLDGATLRAEHPQLGTYHLDAAPAPGGELPTALFCENETNTVRLFGDAVGHTRYPKDGINDHVISGAATVNPDQRGTKAAWWYVVDVEGGGRVELRLRLHLVEPGARHDAADALRLPTAAPDRGPDPSRAAWRTGSQWAEPWHTDAFDAVVRAREADADEFYAALVPPGTDAERARIVRQACAGMIWGKQIYNYDVGRWLDGDPGQPVPPTGHDQVRNTHWRHLDAFDVLSMPDPWEYPWFAAWDLAFHAIVLAHVDPAFAKYQLVVMCREWFQHPNGALPAYEWDFDDVNPPVHAFATLRVFLIDGGQDHEFLARVFHKLLLNFTWWVNRQDREGNNLFEGGFLGLDNISPFDRSNLPPGMYMEQSDGTAWMAFYCLNMLVMALFLAEQDSAYEDLATKFLEHFVLVTRALNNLGLYDREDGFFYDVLVTPEGFRVPIKVLSIAGLVPLLSSVALHGSLIDHNAHLRKSFAAFLTRSDITLDQLEELGHFRRTADERQLLLSVLDPKRLRQALTEVFDEESFLSPGGLRSLSKRHRTPVRIHVGGVDGTISYEPGESTTPMFGGNSNWRGPVWFPLNYMVLRSLTRFHHFLGDDYTIEVPTGSGRERTLRGAAQDLADRLVSIFLPGPDGRRPVNDGVDRFDLDPAWRDLLLFYEYFHGDTAAGLGASHQTGWTGLVADLILDPPG